jgi:hypothetical protein
MMRDRSEADVLPITQDLLAEMLGVQRPSLTHAVAELEEASLIAAAVEVISGLRRGLLAFFETLSEGRHLFQGATGDQALSLSKRAVIGSSSRPREHQCVTVTPPNAPATER